MWGCIVPGRGGAEGAHQEGHHRERLCAGAVRVRVQEQGRAAAAGCGGVVLALASGPAGRQGVFALGHNCRVLQGIELLAPLLGEELGVRSAVADAELDVWECRALLWTTRTRQWAGRRATMRRSQRSRSRSWRISLSARLPSAASTGALRHQLRPACFARRHGDSPCGRHVHLPGAAMGWCCHAPQALGPGC